MSVGECGKFDDGMIDHHLADQGRARKMEEAFLSQLDDPFGNLPACSDGAKSRVNFWKHVHTNREPLSSFRALLTVGRIGRAQYNLRRYETNG